MKKHIHFVYDFKFPNGYLQFGYNKSTLRNNFLYQIENDLEEDAVLMASPHNPSNLRPQVGMFADEYINTNHHWNKLGVNQVQDILNRKHYKSSETYFFITLEATTVSNFFEYYLNPNLNFDDLFSPKLLNYFINKDEFKLILIDNREGSYNHDVKLFTKFSKWLTKHNIRSNKKVEAHCRMYVLSICTTLCTNLKIALGENHFYTLQLCSVISRKPLAHTYCVNENCGCRFGSRTRWVAQWAFLVQTTSS